MTTDNQTEISRIERCPDCNVLSKRTPDNYECSNCVKNCIERTSNDEQNEAEIFCLIHSFKERLTAQEWAKVEIGEGVQLNKKNDELLILDQAIRRIAKELSTRYKVVEL